MRVRQLRRPLRRKLRARRHTPIYVVHCHDTHGLHFDFRLEVEGTLIGWCVPQGLAGDISEGRLARRTEDHPLEYASFEGRIPDGLQGAGTVIVWDGGTYINATCDETGREIPIDQAIEDGYALVELHGKNLRGRYALTRTSVGRHDLWRIAWAPGQAASEPDGNQEMPRSMLTGRAMHEVEPMAVLSASGRVVHPVQMT